MSRSRPLTYDEFLAEAVPCIRRVFASLDPFREPFSPDVPRRMILFQEFLYSLDDAQLTSLTAAAKSVGDTKFYEVTGRWKLDGGYEGNPAYVFFVDEPSAYLERQAPFRSPSLETALVSGSGKWGFLLSHENAVLVGGSERFISTLLDSYPWVEILDWEGQERATVPPAEQVRLFLDDVGASSRTDEVWLPSYLRHIYGNEEAERLLRDAQSRPKPSWRFPHEKHSWRFSHQQVSGSTPRRVQSWSRPGISPPVSAALSAGGSVTAIFPHNRWVWSLAALFLTVLWVFSLAGLSAASSTLGDKAVFVVLLIFFGALAFVVWRQVVSPRPVMRLDQDVVECRHGRVSWSEVETVLVVHEHRENWSWACLLFVLRRGTSPRPPASRYLTGRVWRSAFEERKLRKRLAPTSNPVLAVGLSGCRKQALEAVDRYYVGRVAIIPASALTAELGRS